MPLDRGSAGLKYSPSTVIAGIAEHAHHCRSQEMKEHKMKMKMKNENKKMKKK